MNHLEKILELIKEEWRVHLGDQGEICAYADRGDFNCPHRRQYDPADGHGVSQVWVGEHYDEEKIDSLEDAIDKLYDKCKKVIPGEPYDV
jgi:hypothetical protein